MWKVLLTLSLLCWGLCSSAEISCRDKNGGEVDWYILYKVPKLNNVPLTGLEYFYIDAKTMEQNNIINDPNGVLERTLKPLLNPPKNFGYISYNDQPPGCTAKKEFGHSKGIVMTDKSTGVWLLHSTPSFPYDRKHGKLWPESGSRNAQTFICVNFNYNQFQKIGKHLQYIRAFPFDYDIPEDFYSELKSVVKREDLDPNKPFLPQELKSRGGQRIKIFAKYSTDRNADDLYFLMARDLKSSLSARTWQGSTEHEESDCKDDWTVFITEYIQMTLSVEKKRPQVSFTDCNDHSKWCVTEDQNKPWTCIADLNKAYTQNSRPGGALCIESAAVRDKFKNFIQTKQPCRKKPKP